MSAPDIEVERVRPFRWAWTLTAYDRTLKGSARTRKRAWLRAYRDLGPLCYCVTPTYRVNGVEIPRETARPRTDAHDKRRHGGRDGPPSPYARS